MKCSDQQLCGGCGNPPSESALKSEGRVLSEPYGSYEPEATSTAKARGKNLFGVSLMEAVAYKVMGRTRRAEFGRS